MSRSEYYDALKLIEAYKDQAHFSGRKEEALIRKAEQTLGLSFPPLYREFLQRFGYLRLAGHEYYGIIQDNFSHSTVPNGIWVTLNERKTDRLPKEFIIVYNTEDGLLYAIDTRTKNEFNESPIVVWHLGLSKPGDTLEVIYEDFGTLLFETLKQTIHF